MATGRTNVFGEWYTRSSFFSTDYLLGSVNVLIPIAVIFIFLALSAIGMIGIIIYRVFFLNRVQLYGDVKDFFNKNLKRNAKETSSALQESGDEIGVQPNTSFAAGNTSFEGTTEALSPDDVLTDLEQVIEEVMQKNVWCTAFENILADNKNNVRNMRALHSILNIPLDCDLSKDATNEELENNNAKLAVAIRRRQKLAKRNALPYFTSSSNFRENILTSRPGARVITEQLEALEYSMKVSQAVSEVASSRTPQQNQTCIHQDESCNESLNDTTGNSTDSNSMEEEELLNNLVQAVTNTSIADPNYLLRTLRG